MVNHSLKEKIQTEFCNYIFVYVYCKGEFCIYNHCLDKKEKQPAIFLAGCVDVSNLFGGVFRGNGVPIYYVPPGRYVIRAAILVIQIIGMLPDINA
jgi:hypothetical protein